MDKPVSNKKKIGGVIVFVIAFAVSYFAVGHFVNGGNSDYAQLVKTSEEMNKSFPTQVDADTRLDSTTVQETPLTLNYHYTAVNIEKSTMTVKPEDVIKQLKEVTQQNLDTAPEMAEFRSKDVSLKYSYSDKNGVFLFDYTIRPTK